MVEQRLREPGCKGQRLLRLHMTDMSIGGHHPTMESLNPSLPSVGGVERV